MFEHVSTSVSPALSTALPEEVSVAPAGRSELAQPSAGSAGVRDAAAARTTARAQRRRVTEALGVPREHGEPACVTWNEPTLLPVLSGYCPIWNR
jgi:hypothetical protein